ncbi:MAG: ABC transporter ATP-binding protein [Desulfatiglans sp.]|jgi:branched-chain amino acid transport system ATP-binding protein|nr:ABC transporter ATP-binding protein [Thermodesulfobacteriota bacterium]MEE4353155.1 ABC transporter ATP-binding protein [Desulfatiglans sp.]
MLKVENLRVVYFGIVSVLHGVSLQAESNSITALLGGNGSGKSTLMRTISGILPIFEGEIQEGEVKFDEVVVSKMKAVDITKRIRLTYLMEGRPIFEYLNVKENLKASASCRWDSEVQNDIEGILTYFPTLRGRLQSKAGYLSGGEQQMLAMGMALMTNPKFLLLDEPSLGLAPRIVKEIFDIIKKINEERKIGIFLSEQNAIVALKISSYGYVMDNGRVVMDGSSRELMDNADIQEAYLGSADQKEKDYKEAKRYKRRKRWLG